MTIRREKAVGGGLGRREFLAAGAAALAFAIVKPQSVRGAEANSKIEIGLIGCGGRGGWIAKLFQENGNYKFVAGADYFEDKVKTFATKFGVDASRSYTGLSACKKLAESKLDAVVIESPPYFHPGHAAGAVEAGRHVYLAKPPAVDVPGCTLVAESGKKATAKNLVYLIDFQTRADPIFREAVKRVHNGDIGRVVSGEAVYYCGSTFGNAEFDVKDPEVRLRHWTVDNVLSGDIITEQNIHALDVASWVIDEAPVRAVGTCGRKAKKGSGDLHDHFAVVFTFPGDVVVSFASKQYGEGWDDIGVRMFGPRGTLDAHYFGAVSIKGSVPYAGGTMKNLYTEGAVANIAEFHNSIVNKKYDNPTVAPSVRSDLTTILGRTAAHKGGPVTWDEMIKANEKLEFDLKGLKA